MPKAALLRATKTAITAVIADWQIPNLYYQDLWDKFGAWLLNPAVISAFRVLLSLGVDSTLDVAVLRKEFKAIRLDVVVLDAEDFDALVEDMVGSFYIATPEEAELQESLKSGLLRDLADDMYVLARPAEQQPASSTFYRNNFA